jgi:hypothetical protein
MKIGRRSFAQEEVVAPASDKSPATTIDVLASKVGQQLVQTVVDTVLKILNKGEKG